MSGVNAEVESLVRIRYGLIKLQNVANKGLKSTERELKSVDYEASDNYREGCALLEKLKRDIATLEKEADVQQAEYNRKLNNTDENNGRPCVLPYPGPDVLRNRADEKRRIANELDRELSALSQHFKKYKASKETFFDEFKKIATNPDGGENGTISNVLEKSIVALDDYVHINIGAGGSSVYDNYVEQMNAQNQSVAEGVRRIQREAFERTL